MLSENFRNIKQLRSTGNLAGAIAGIRASRMEADEDALEAIVCWFTAGNPQEAARTRDNHRWSGAGWAGMAAGALVGTMLGADRAQVLKMAEAAVASGQANHDAFAIYLMALQFGGRVGDAYQRIQAGLAELPPRETLLATVVGDIAVAAGNWQLARHAASVVLTFNPNDVRALLVGSFAAAGLDQAYEALGLAQRANAIAPGAPPAVFQMMRCLNSIGDYYGTVGSFARIKNPAGAAPQILSQLGVAYAGLGKIELAVKAYTDALDGGGSIEAIRGLLRIELETRHPVQSNQLVAKFRREVDADNDATYVLGLMALDRGERGAALDLLRRSMRSTAAGSSEFLAWPVTEPHIRHEYEQLLLLQERGKLGAHGAAALPILKKYYDRSGDPAATFAPEGAEGEALRNALAPYHHMPDKPVTGPVLAEQDYAAIEAQYHKGSPAMVVIENFLTPQALADLRQFCEEASIFKTAYSTGYMGAFLSGGFSPPILLAIADELRKVMPDVVGPHPLMQSWAFKYDQRCQGINMHADFARVNVNFWITPVEACADHSTGGMVIYDAPAPKGWNFQDYNSDSDKMMAFVKLHGAQPIRVPYRENRCVLFDSTLFHTTDEIHFKPGYTNRRVNVTLLYGQGLSTD
jgi:tetratricopeptide (TPR) repeat protein